MVPTQTITFLGFTLNSVDMTIRLTPDRAENLTSLCGSVINKKHITIREFAKLIGKMVASEPGLQLPLFYKDLEQIKDNIEILMHSFNYISNIGFVFFTLIFMITLYSYS